MSWTVCDKHGLWNDADDYMCPACFDEYYERIQKIHIEALKTLDELKRTIKAGKKHRPS